jgi:hypothetical protein
MYDGDDRRRVTALARRHIADSCTEAAAAAAAAARDTAGGKAYRHIAADAANNSKTTASKTRIAFADLLDVALAFQLKARLTFLAPLVPLFRAFDTAPRDGVVSEQQFAALVARCGECIGDVVSDAAIGRMLLRVDKHETGMVTFSECVHVLTPLLKRMQ